MRGGGEDLGYGDATQALGDGKHDEAVRLARQAGQITAGIPGLLARTCSSVLTMVLAGAGVATVAVEASLAPLGGLDD